MACTAAMGGVLGHIGTDTIITIPTIVATITETMEVMGITAIGNTMETGVCV